MQTFTGLKLDYMYKKNNEDKQLRELLKVYNRDMVD
jgi:hypothetical protein